MSGLQEIKRWVQSEIDLTNFSDPNTAYEHLNDPNSFDWRNDLDDILLEDKPKFIEWLKTQVSTPEPIRLDFRIQRVKGYSYVRNNKTITVPSYTRRLKVK